MNPTRLIGQRITTILALVVLVGLMGTLAPSDTVATTFSNGKVDLKIDSKAWYNGAVVPSATWALKDLVPGVDKFFNFDDVKPGDFGCTVISIHAEKADAWACLDFKNLKNFENGVNEPESAVDPNGSASGELASATKFFSWFDDGDGKYEPPSEKVLFGTSVKDAEHVLNEKTYVIGDSKYGGSLKKDTSKNIGMCWCVGNLSVQMPSGRMICEGKALGNAVQTDSFSVDVRIRAAGVTDQPKFRCDAPPPRDGPGSDAWHEQR